MEILGHKGSVLLYIFYFKILYIYLNKFAKYFEVCCKHAIFGQIFIAIQIFKIF